VDHYEWSPDGTQIAFTTRPLPDSATIRRLTDDGVLYDDTRMWMLDILRHQWRRDPAELWLHDLRTHRDTRVWQAPQAGATSWSLGIVSMAWSPDSRKIAVSYASRTSVATGWVDYDVAIVRPAERAVSVLVATDSMSEHGAAWSPDGKRLAFLSEFNVPLNTTGSRSAIGIADLATGKTRYVARGKTGSSAERLWWVRRGAALAFESASAGGQHRDRGGVYVVELPGGAVRRLTPAEDHISSCGPVVNERIACVRQNPNLPPDPAVVDLATGQSQTIATANPQVADVIRGEVTELRWANKFGAETNGYLIRPFNYVPGHRYPLVLILYGFQGRFVAGAEWITNYPAQVLARDGFAVLLWNYPRWDDWPGNNFSRASVADGYGPLSSLESIVNILVIQGLADAHRVGIMGLSHGGYLTEFALTHSSQFRVASIANDGDFNPGIYWLVGTQAHRVLYEKFLGGPPHGATLANWLTYSPALNANRVSAPVLMETNAEETLFGLETFTALRHHHIPVELVVYPDDSHVLSQPRHRLASMQRNLDWFRFWLLGREDPDSAKQEQYERWGRMRADLPKLTHWPPAPLCATGAGTSSASPSRRSTRSNCDLAGARGARH
jgi:dipeptidyl aminopeptidase/acylaminoacyl peptidase